MWGVCRVWHQDGGLRNELQAWKAKNSDVRSASSVRMTFMAVSKLWWGHEQAKRSQAEGRHPKQLVNGLDAASSSTAATSM